MITEAKNHEPNREVQSAQEFIKKWRSQYPGVLGDLIFAFCPTDIPYPPDRLTESYTHYLLGVVSLGMPKEVNNRLASPSSDAHTKDQDFINDVNRLFGAQIADLARHQHQLLRHIAREYPFRNSVDEVFQTVHVYFAELFTFVNSRQDSWLKLAQAKKLAEDKLRYRQEDVDAGSEASSQLNNFTQRHLEVIDDPAVSDKDLDETARAVLGDRLDGVLTQLFRKLILTIARDSVKPLHLVSTKRMKIYPNQWIYKGDQVETIPVQVADLAAYTVKIDYYRQEMPAISNKRWSDITQDSELLSWPQFQFVDESGNSFVLFCGDFSDLPTLPRDDDRIQIYQLNWRNSSPLATIDFLPLQESKFFDDGVYETPHFATNCWMVMSSYVMEVLALTRTLIRAGRIPSQELLEQVQSLQQSDLFSIFSKELLPDKYDGSVSVLKRIVAYQTQRMGVKLAVDRERQALLHGHPSIFELLQVEAYGDLEKPSLRPGSALDFEGEKSLKTALLSQEEYEQAKKTIELLGSYSGQQPFNFFLEIPTIEPANPKWPVQLPTAKNPSSFLYLSTAQLTQTKGRRIQLASSSQLPVTGLTVYKQGKRCEPEFDYRSWQTSTGAVSVEFPYEQAVGIEWTLQAAPEAEEKTIEALEINDTVQKRNNLEKLITTLIARPELAYQQLGQILAERVQKECTIADIIKLQHWCTDYSFDNHLQTQLGATVLDQLSQFAKQEKLTMQCGQSARLLVFILTSIFEGSGIEISFEEVSGYKLDPDNLIGDTEGETRNFNVRASDRHAVVKAKLGQQSAYLDATGAHPLRKTAPEPLLASLEQAKKQFEVTAPRPTADLVERQLVWITETVAKIAGKKYGSPRNVGLHFVADLPPQHPLKQVVATLLKFTDQEIDETELKTSLQQLRTEFRLDEPEILMNYLARKKTSRAQKEALILVSIITATVAALG